MSFLLSCEGLNSQLSICSKFSLSASTIKSVSTVIFPSHIYINTIQIDQHL